MQHALGLKERWPESSRNYFLCDGDPDWDELVAAGFAKSNKAPDWVSGTVTYQVLPPGEVAARSALPAPEKPTKYKDYLRADGGFSFPEYLGINKPKVERRLVGNVRTFRMYRVAPDFQRDTEGDWCASVASAKTSYKEKLKARSKSAI